MTSRVAVVMPVHNGGHLLGHAIDSVRAQSLTDWELILVDDGSEDGSADVARSYADDRIRVVTQTSSGIATALNCGIALVVGDYIARMDADDVSMPRRLAAQAAFLDAHPDVVCVGSAFEAMAMDETFASWRGVPLDDADIRRMLRFQNPYCHGSVMLRRDAVLSVGGYSREAEPAEDYDLWLRLAAVGRLAALPDVLYRHRANPGGVSTRAADQQKGVTRALARVVPGTPGRTPLREARQAVTALPQVPHREALRDALAHARRLGAVADTRDGTLGDALAAWAGAVVVDPRPAAVAKTATRAARAFGRRILGRLSGGSSRRASGSGT